MILMQWWSCTYEGVYREGGGVHVHVCVFYSSYNGTVHAAAAVIAIIVPAGQVGCGHERVTLVGTAVLKEDVHTLLTVSLPCVRQCRIAVSIPCHDVHAVLQRDR